MENEDVLDLMVEWEDDGFHGGIRRFKGLKHGDLFTLINMGIADPTEAQNAAPTTQVFLEFLKRNPGFSAHGYAVTPERNDSRVTLEGVEGHGDIDDFRNIFGEADSIEVRESQNHAYCWFD